MIDQPFLLHAAFDLAAVFLLGVTGALAAIGKRYDLVGLVVLALVTALAGGVLRDVLIQRGPPLALTDGRYLVVALAGAGAAAVLRRRLHRLGAIISVLDALGLAVYGVVGAQKALVAGLPVPAALLLGTLNAVGGGLLRDVLVREEPLVFKPGEWYALSALAGCGAFAALTVGLRVAAQRAALVGIAVAFSTRLLSMWLGWHTAPVGHDQERDGEGI